MRPQIAVQHGTHPNGYPHGAAKPRLRKKKLPDAVKKGKDAPQAPVLVGHALDFPPAVVKRL